MIIKKSLLLFFYYNVTIVENDHDQEMWANIDRLRSSHSRESIFFNLYTFHTCSTCTYYLYLYL